MNTIDEGEIGTINTIDFRVKEPFYMILHYNKRTHNY